MCIGFRMLAFLHANHQVHRDLEAWLQLPDAGAAREIACQV